MLREIDIRLVTEAVAELSIKANKTLPCDITQKIECAVSREEGIARSIMEDIKRNSEVAAEMDIPSLPRFLLLILKSNHIP